MTNEEWRVINNFPNYSVSNLGNVKNNITNKIMRQNVKGGYKNISLTNDKKRTSCKVHRLVALSFIPNPDNKPTVNHKDKNKCNNVLDNLEWMTTEEQMQHKSIGLVYKSNSEVDEPKEQIDYLAERLKQNKYYFTSVGGSKTRRKKYNL